MKVTLNIAEDQELKNYAQGYESGLQKGKELWYEGYCKWKIAQSIEMDDLQYWMKEISKLKK